MLLTLPLSRSWAQTDSVSVSTSELADRIIEEAKTHLGVPYRYGASGPKAFDCSAFTRYVYGKFGYDLARSASGQCEQGVAVEGSLSNLQKGDIVIFSGRRISERAGHVGIFIELDETGRNFTFIHAAVHGGIQVNRSDEKYYADRLLGVRRILPTFYSVPVVDTVAQFNFPIDSTVVSLVDTLPLSERDRRVVLFEDGTWSYVDDEGHLAAPSDNMRIVLDGTGHWTAATLSSHTIPSIRKSAPAASSADTLVAAASDSVPAQPAETPQSVAAQQPAEPQPVYYTVRSGDTLSKIASRNHTTVRALCRLNNIKETTILKVGRKLRVK